MAKKISQLAQATQVKSDDVTVIVQDGETKKLPLSMMVTKQDIEDKKVAGLAKLDEIEATYENDTYTPTITVKNKSSVKVGEGDGVDYSANVMDGHVKSAILKGNTGYRDIDTGEFLETFEEGRNLELVSVKMPVLTTIGKNLINMNDYALTDGVSITQQNENSITFNAPYTWGGLQYHMQLNPNTKYAVSMDRGENTIVQLYVRIKNENGNYSGAIGGGYDCHFTTNNTGFVLITIESCLPNQTNLHISNLQLEEGSTTTPYEPFKSNILTVNEDVELRGIGDVKDELNLLTGEFTQRFGEVVLDGVNYKCTHATTNSDETKRLDINFTFEKFVGTNNWVDLTNMNTSVICDKAICMDGFFAQLAHPGKNAIASYNGALVLFIEDKTILTVEKANEWLKQNPITVQYELKTPTIKTVDLMPSGTYPSTTPYCWKNGHIQLSSSGLLPNLEYSVVTSRAGQINQNATMIVKNDKRIFDLEILLAGGLVNTTYQALTLQNQVETGLSKVSLNSETEPDYLLYHMIMKLIEEKAYKLDDLTEKVSVFYLYEKLSDEQFETIYSALYPFVEDEIIEEPVVEELPEVVEDGVIM